MEYVYAALMLHKLGKPVDEAGIKKAIESVGGQVDEARVKTLLTSLKGVDIDKELESAVAFTAPTSGAGESKEAEDKSEDEKEEKKEAAAEGLSALFG